MTTYYAHTQPGVEEIAWLEIRKQLPKTRFGEYLFAKEQNGIIVFESPCPPEDTLQLRTVEDMFILGLDQAQLSRGFNDLREIPLWIKRSESLGQALKTLMRFRKFSGAPRYRVICRSFGKHQYRPADFEESVNAGLYDRLSHWIPDDKKPQVEIWANLLGSRLIVGLRLSKRRKDQRPGSKAPLRHSLPPSVAAAMVFLSEPDPNDVFLDPMCRDGLILCERHHASEYELLIGGESDEQKVRLAKRQVAKCTGRQMSKVDMRPWDARKLPLDTTSIDKVVTVLAFGKQQTLSDENEAFYAATLGEISRVVRPGGRVVMLSSQYEMLKRCLRDQPGLNTLTGYSIAARGIWGRLYIVERRE